MIQTQPDTDGIKLGIGVDKVGVTICGKVKQSYGELKTY